jgi:hypothetical protein
VALTCLVLLPAAVPAPARQPAARQSKVPRWDARGVGLPAWQGLACLDVNGEATRIALGTIAPAGHYETGLFVGDFNGDGRPDLAVFGYTLTGVGWDRPPAAYIWLQPARTKSGKE